MIDGSTSPVTIVRSAKQLKAVPFALQGDEEVYTPAKLRVREENRDDPRVRASLQGFWDAVVFDKHVREAGYDPNADEYDLDTSTSIITRSHYIEIYASISRWLQSSIGSSVDEEHARRLAEEAWAQDTTGDELEFDRSAPLPRLEWRHTFGTT